MEAEFETKALLYKNFKQAHATASFQAKKLFTLSCGFETTLRLIIPTTSGHG